MADMEQETGAPEGEEQAAPGFSICIKVGGDGKIMVGSGPDYETAEESAQPAGSAKEAMSMAMAAIQSGGKLPSASDDDEFNAGFGKPEKGPVIDKQRPDDEEM